MFKKILIRLRDAFIYSLAVTTVLCGGYFGMVAYAAWQHPEDLHPPITEGWTANQLEIRKAINDSIVMPQIDSIYADDRHSGLTKLFEAADVQLAYSSLFVPAKKPFLQALAFTGHYMVDTSIAGGVWKIVAIFIGSFIVGMFPPRNHS